MYVIIIKRFCTFASQKCCPKTALIRLKTNHNNPKPAQEHVQAWFWGDIYIYIYIERERRASPPDDLRALAKYTCTRWDGERIIKILDKRTEEQNSFLLLDMFVARKLRDNEGLEPMAMGKQVLTLTQVQALQIRKFSVNISNI